MKLLVVTGVSGAGKSSALSVLEDAGFYCVDNLPSGLLRQFLRYHLERAEVENIAVGIDTRASEAELRLLPEELEAIRASGVTTQILFLDSDHNSLLKRYSQTRRRHPLTNEHTHLADALIEERQVLSTIYELSDQVIDTSHIMLAELRQAVQDIFVDEGRIEVSLLLESFGFKHGAPTHADFVFDVRCLPNPYYIEELRSQTGLDDDVRNYLDAEPEANELRRDLCRFLDRWLPGCARSKRRYVAVAIGCTGGQHRSVYMVERLKAHLGPCYPRLQVRHRDWGAR